MQLESEDRERDLVGHAQDCFAVAEAWFRSICSPFFVGKILSGICRPPFARCAAQLPLGGRATFLVAGFDAFLNLPMELCVSRAQGQHKCPRRLRINSTRCFAMPAHEMT